MSAAADPRVAAGMATQFASRRSRIAAGERPIGWKLGFGTAAALQKFALAGPLVGYMMEKSLLPSGATADLTGWAKPVAEPEIAVRIAADAGPGEAVKLDGFAPAIELADLYFAPEDVEQILAGNIYHRYVLHGTFTPLPADWSSLRGNVERSGGQFAAVDDVSANTGVIPDILRHCAETLAASGEQFRKGEIVILGSVVPPIFLAPEDTSVAFAVDGAGEVRVAVTTRAA